MNNFIQKYHKLNNLSFVKSAHSIFNNIMIKFFQVMIKFLKKLKEALNKEDTQTVYRYVSSVELRRIQNADTQHLGVYFDNLKLSNYHKKRKS